MNPIYASRIKGADRYGKQHVPTADHLTNNFDVNYSGRVDNLRPGLSGKTADDINRETKLSLILSPVKYPLLKQGQLDAARDAFKAQLPYLSPENSRIPAGTTVDSLLKQKSESGGRVHYAKASVAKKDEELFEKLQRELAAGSDKIASRQLYQLMNGDIPTEIRFVERGPSCCLSHFEEKKNLVFVNTNTSVLDPESHTVTPLCVVLGHEIEHANLPPRMSLWLHKHTNSSLTNGEEIRVIDGYENAMLKAMGLKPRTTHSSYLVPVAKSDGRTIAFPLQTDSGTGALKRGEQLQGKIVQANGDTVTIQKSDGTRVKLDTALLLFSIHGAGQIRRMGFEDPHSALEKAITKIKTSVAFQQELQRLSLDGASVEEKICLALLHTTMKSPEVQRKINEWRIAAERHDPVSIWIDHDGRINMHRVSLEPDPIGKLNAKLAAERWHNVRNRLIAGMLLTGSIAIISLMVLYAMHRHKLKKEKTARLLAQANAQLNPPVPALAQPPLAQLSYMTLQRPLLAQAVQSQSSAQTQPQAP